MQRVEQRAEFIIQGAIGQDIDLAFVTEVLGEQPTTLWRQGEPMRHSGRPRKTSAWIWETQEAVDYDSEAVLCTVLDRFEPHADRIREFCARLCLDVQVGLVVSMYGDVTIEANAEVEVGVSTPALNFSIDTLRRLVALGADLDIDQYVIAPDEVSSSEVDQ